MHQQKKRIVAVGKISTVPHLPAKSNISVDASHFDAASFVKDTATSLMRYQVELITGRKEKDINL